MFMRPTLFSALILMVSVFLLSASHSEAAESAAPAAGSQKSGKRPAEGEKKATGAGQTAPGTGTPSATEPVKRKTSSSSASAKPAAPKAGTEDERFASARKAAAEDPKIVELREKADLAKTKDAGERAMRAYLRALYGKMRTLEPSLEERINLTEAAALKAVSKGE
jgi:hypothetical protein